MALTRFALKLIAPYLQGDVLSFGYPDLLMTPEKAGEILGRRLEKTTPFGSSHKQSIPLADTAEAFAGCRWTCVDLMPTRGLERVVDLNEPQTFGAFDLVIDAGTIEHCANIGQALMNAAQSVKVGGHVFHSPPLSMANHGFYNVSPTLLMDFYEQNGWTVKHLSGFSSKAPYAPIQVAERKRFVMDDGAALYFLAQRTSASALRWPIQSKYLK